MTIERHGRDRQTRANEQRLLTTLTSIGDAVLITDAMGRIIFLNPVAEYLLHCSARAVIGLLVDEVMPLIDAETRVPIDHPVWAVLRNGESAVLSVETLLIAQDGTQICIDDSAAPIRTLAGQIEGVAIVFRDATLRRQLAEAKHHERLRLLAGGIAHDLNNLFTVVISNTELIQLDIDEHAPAHKDLETVKNSGTPRRRFGSASPGLCRRCQRPARTG
jgi:PAS domain S-box-containing protein